MISSQTISLDALEDILRRKIMQKTKGGPRELYLAFQNSTMTPVETLHSRSLTM